MKSLATLILFSAILLGVPSSVAAVDGAGGFSGGSGWGSTREEVLANRQRRKHQITGLVNHMRKKLADHSAGEITLDPKQKADFERRVDLYGRKLNMMEKELEDDVRTPAEGWIIT